MRNQRRRRARRITAQSLHSGWIFSRPLSSPAALILVPSLCAASPIPAGAAPALKPGAAVSTVAAKAVTPAPGSALPRTETTTTTAATGASAPIAINIDGRIVESDPGPLLDGGAVFVPLRGVLENLGAKVEYQAAERRIEITQADNKLMLRPGEAYAVSGVNVIPIAAPRLVDNRAFVPLRGLAELFGYRVAWLPGNRTVAIYTKAGAAVQSRDHREALEAAGPFGVGLDLSTARIEDMPHLLDEAKAVGAGMVQVRFDWQLLEPTKGSEFQWPFFDRVVKEARERDLVVVGILGPCTQWASVSQSTDPKDWKLSPPRDEEYPAWSNYVGRTVGRYKNDVHAWQVWENPAAANFRSVARNYRKIARLAVEAARKADAKVLIHAAEPGGVELDFINDLARNGLTPLLDGIAVYPVSQWQPGALNPAENFLLPYATLQEHLKLADGKERDYWVGGLAYPVLEVPGVDGVEGSAGPAVAGKAAVTPAALTSDAAVTNAEALRQPADRPEAPAPGARPVTPRPGLLEAFSPAAQGGYLVRAMSLALATGTGKVFWSRLQDAPDVAPLQPINPAAGTGLLRTDGSQRPSFAAYKNLTAQLAGKKYAGNLGLGQGIVALLFSDKEKSTLVAWSPAKGARIVLTSSGVDPKMKDALWVSTRPDAQVLGTTGKVLSGADGVLEIGEQPVFITNVAYESVRLAGARFDGKPLKMTPSGPSYREAESIKATFGVTGGEDGLFWRKYADFGGVARIQDRREGRVGLMAEAQRDVYDLLSSRPFIYLDVADDFMYFAQGVPVEVEVEVYRPPGGGDSNAMFSNAAGFRLEYDSPSGFKSTPFQTVEPGTGWAKYQFTLPDATFANAEGYDLLINANGTRTDLVFGSVTVKRAASKGESKEGAAAKEAAGAKAESPAPASAVPATAGAAR